MTKPLQANLKTFLTGVKKTDGKRVTPKEASAIAQKIENITVSYLLMEMNNSFCEMEKHIRNLARIRGKNGKKETESLENSLKALDESIQEYATAQLEKEQSK